MTTRTHRTEIQIETHAITTIRADRDQLAFLCDACKAEMGRVLKRRPQILFTEHNEGDEELCRNSIRSDKALNNSIQEK